MKKTIIAVLSLMLVVGVVAALAISTSANDLPFTNLFESGFEGYTSDEGQILAGEYVSSKEIPVEAGQTLWFGPCDPVQYFQLVGLNGDGKTVTDKIRGKELTVVDTFGNGTVVYSYTVPQGVAKLVISVAKDVSPVFSVSATELNSVKYMAYWEKMGVNTDGYVGKNSYYKVTPGQKLYFGVITKEGALESGTFNDQGDKSGTIAEADLRLVESFGAEFGIYCYTVPSGVSFVRVAYDANYQQYYHYLLKDAADTSTDEAIVDEFITVYGIPRLPGTTVAALSGKSALFVGDSITYGARDRAKIYAAGGWAGRIGYFADMNVTNNGVSGACITTARVESHSNAHYIYNNLVAAKDQKFSYVIMHGLFNDASIPVEIGTAQGASKFDPEKVDVTKFASALELLFYTAKTQHPEATLGYIVNFKTDRNVDQAPYVAAAIAICDDWGIPFLDLYNRTGFSVEFDDGLHPSSAGYDSMYGIVANWMATLEAPKVEVSGSEASVMSYNIYYSPYSIPEGTINNRPDKILSLINENDPDILLLQEVRKPWMNILKTFAADKGYSYYGYSHNSGEPVDAMTDTGTDSTPIFWKTSKYELVDSGHFWASNTPDKPSATWDNGLTSRYPRCINWVVLKDKATGGKLLVSNIHGVPDLDENDDMLRNLSNQLIIKMLDEIRTAHGGIATFLGGDFNMADGSSEYNILVGNSFRDVCKVAGDNPKQGTYNAWNRTDPAKFTKGDYMFMTENVTAKSFKVIVDDMDPDNTGLHISDHCPLIAVIGY